MAQRGEEKLAAIDLIVQTLLDHEKKLDQLIDELEHIVLALNSVVEKMHEMKGHE